MATDPAACPHTADCPLFEKFKLSSALKVWKVFYCQNRYADCVRFQSMRDAVPIPPTLLPDGSHLEGTD